MSDRPPPPPRQACTERQRLRTLHRILGLALKLGADAGPALRFLAGCPQTAPTTAALPARLSPLEQFIVEAIEGAGEALGGKEVAARVGHPYDPRLKSLLRNLVDRGVLLHTSDGYRLAPPDAEPPATPAVVYVQVPTGLSPLEQSIVDCLREAGEPLQGKEVAPRTGQPYDPRLKAILRNLVDRGVLAHSPGQGYRLTALLAPTSAAITTEPTANP